MLAGGVVRVAADVLLVTGEPADSGDTPRGVPALRVGGFGAAGTAGGLRGRGGQVGRVELRGLAGPGTRVVGGLEGSLCVEWLRR